LDDEARIAELQAELAAKGARIVEQDAKLAEQDAKLAEQAAKIAELTAQLAKLTEILGRNSRNSHLPPSSDGPGSGAKGKPRGKWGQAGRTEGPPGAPSQSAAAASG
jgi:transposase